MKRLLFVDDEPMILAGIKNVLRAQRSCWEMQFVESGEAALESLSESPADVIVSDMRMPGMDGAELLLRVREQYPLTARILLTGQASKTDLLRAIMVAQQTISKPCPPVLLRETIERALSVQGLISNDGLKTMVGKVGRLPACPRSYQRLTEVMQRDNASIAEIGAVVAEDPALSVRTLAIANSSYYGLPTQTTSIPKAVGFLGLEVVRSLALGMEVFSKGHGTEARSLTLSNLAENAVLRARVAKQIVANRLLEDVAYAGALLIDIGHVLLWKCLAEEYDNLLVDAERHQTPLYELEQKQLGFTHAQAGGYLLALWGVPLPILELVAGHNVPELIKLAENGPARAIHIADRLVTALRAGREDPLADIEPSIRSRQDVEAHLAQWLALAQEGVAKS